MQRVLVHDFAGHPFQVQLSRTLARRGIDVLHAYAGGLTTGKGDLAVRPDDPATFRVAAVDIGRPFERYDAVRRLRDEAAYGRALVDLLRGWRPEAVLSANTPMLPQRRLQAATRRTGARFVFWLQDVLSVGTAAQLGRWGPPGRAVGAVAKWWERGTLRRSDAVVAIAGDFEERLRTWGLPSSRISVIENWAPLAELPLRSRSTSWARRHGFENEFVLLYSGTLGLKHDPGHLASLAEAVDGVATVVVVSEGVGANWLRRVRTARGLDNLVVLPFEPWSIMPEVLATADVLLALLEPSAGRFSVPSKVLSYHCAGRAILAAIPKDNLAARLIDRVGSGVVVEPGDVDGFVSAARRLAAEDEVRASMGRRGRRYAERTFDIERITDRFEDVLRGVDHRRASAQ